jgi:hypothetical protein
MVNGSLKQNNDQEISTVLLGLGSEKVGWL